MRKILEDLYYGNITPNIRTVKHGTSLQQAMEQAEECEEKLTALLGWKRKNTSAPPAQCGE